MLARMSFTITISIFLSVIICLSMFRSENRSKVSFSRSQISQAEKFHPDESTAKSEEIWFGLYPTKDGYKLIPSRITVEAVYDSARDDKGEKTREQQGNRPMKPLFLVKPPETLKNDPISTRSSRKIILAPDASLNFTFDNQGYHLTAAGDAKTDSTALPAFPQSYKLKLSLLKISPKDVGGSASVARLFD